jgi:hypothetical protein
MCEEGWWGHISMGNLTRAEGRSNRSGGASLLAFREGAGRRFANTQQIFSRKVL